MFLERGGREGETETRDLLLFHAYEYFAYVYVHQCSACGSQKRESDAQELLETVALHLVDARN